MSWYDKQLWRQRCLTSTKKIRFSNNEGWVFNLLSFVSNKSPLHLFRISVDKTRKTYKRQKREWRVNTEIWSLVGDSPWSWTTKDLKLLQIWVWSSVDSSERVEKKSWSESERHEQHEWCHASCLHCNFLPSPTASSSCRSTDSWSAAAWHWQLPLDRAEARRVEGGPRNGYCNKTQYYNEPKILLTWCHLKRTAEMQQNITELSNKKLFCTSFCFKN